MKALSIQQPWAWLIVTGEKPVENRGWVSNYTGPLLIHAGLSFDKAGYQWVRRNFPSIRMPKPSGFALGALVGSVRMYGCVHPVETEYHSPWFSGPYGFLFVEARVFETPIPYRGQLGFFEVPERAVEGVKECRR